jgi:dual specificity tyrosine-phosphorylation-regulated kinase 2/3/4
MQKTKETEAKNLSPNSKTRAKPSATQSTRRSRKQSSSPKVSKSNTTSSKTNPKRQKATSKMIPKLNPPSSRLHQSSQRKSSSRRHKKSKSSAPNEKIVLTSSSKRILKNIENPESLQAGPSESEITAWSFLPLPQSPCSIVENFSKTLSKYEKSEILNYSEVFCIGVKASKSKTKSEKKLNFGFDDERGDYRVAIHDHIGYRFEILKTLGSGSFGQVLLVRDHKTSENFALKIIRNKTRFHQQALVEVEVLALLTEKDCNDQYSTVHMVSHFMFRKHMVRTS